MFFENETKEMLARSNAKEIYDFLADYHELEPCCEYKPDAPQCNFSVLRAKLKELNALL